MRRHDIGEVKVDRHIESKIMLKHIFLFFSFLKGKTMESFLPTLQIVRGTTGCKLAMTKRQIAKSVITMTV